jgi:hypothetical protein
MINSPEYRWQNPINVYAPCLRELIPENQVEVLNVEEGLQGEDQLTYLCPYCQKEHTSVRLG